MISPSSYDPALDAVPAPARVIRSLSLLALSGASFALALQFVSMGSTLGSYAAGNALNQHDRVLVIVTIAVGALVPLLVSGVVLLVARGRAVGKLDRVSRLLAPVTLAALVPPLFTSAYAAKPLTYLALLTATGVLVSTMAELSLTASEGPAPRFLELLRRAFRFVSAPFRLLARPRPALIASAVAGALYATYTAHLTILDLHRLTMGSYDMGFFDNQMANSLAGHFFRNTLMYGVAGGNSIAGHAHFAHVLFLPIYALHPSSELLLVLQAAFAGMATVPLFFFASTQISPGASLVVCLSYLLFAPLHGGQFYDFHWLLMAPFTFFTFAYGVVKSRTWLIVVPLVFFLLLREDMSPGIAATGLFLVLTGARPRLGAVLLGVGVVAFGLVKFVIMPAAGTWWFENIYKGLSPAGETGYGPILRTLVSNPVFAFTTLLTEAKLIYALHLLAPLAFLPLRRLALAILLVPGCMLTLLTTDYGAATSIYYQYPVHWVPYLFTATVLALRVVNDTDGRTRARAALIALAFCMTAHSFVFGVVFQPREFKGGGGKVALTLTDAEKRAYEDVRALIGLIPPKASVMATEFEVPLISNRPDAFAAALYPTDAEYILVQADHHLLNGKEAMRKVFQEHDYQLVLNRNRAYLFRKGPKDAATKAALAALGLG